LISNTENTGVPKSSGSVVSASLQFTDQFIPFTCFSYSDGDASVAAESDARIGFEYVLRKDQAWSLGAD
jgi:hypothetical protein